MTIARHWNVSVYQDQIDAMAKIAKAEKVNPRTEVTRMVLNEGLKNWSHIPEVAASITHERYRKEVALAKKNRAKKK
jgi:hypothetical protein